MGGVSRWRVAALLAVLVLAAGLRGWGVWSGALLWHPDELFMVIYPLGMFNGDLNPHVFTYPGSHFYLLAIVYWLQYLLQTAADGSGLLEWIARSGLWAPEATRDTARWVSVAYSLATVSVAGLLGGELAAGRQVMGRWRALTSTTGLLTASLAAVNVLLVRQAPLAGTDTSLAFWFACAALAALRLLRSDRLLDYVVAGALVGICAATKYPGAAVAGGVVTAHLLGGRGLLDRRLWTAGAASILLFLWLAPYTLLDSGTFSDHFLFQFQHASEGRWGLRPGPLYQLTVTLRHGVGSLAWLGWLCVCVWVIYRRPAPQLVVLVALLSGYFAVNWGELVFARYVLPLVSLQLALLGDGIVRYCRYLAATDRLPRQWLSPAMVALSLAIVGQPAYGAWQVARLQGTQDTRTGARNWIESNVPPGSVLCNFGGWAGDPQINTFESLWWRFSKYTEAFPGQDPAWLCTTRKDTDAPYYSFAVQTANEEQAPGRIALVHERRCGYVILHEHALPYSRVDSLLRQRLAMEGQQVATFDPGDSGASVFDPMDAYYIPIAGEYPALPGPRIEIWEIPSYRSQIRPQSALTVLSRTLSLAADAKASEGDVADARKDLKSALELERGNTHALETLARIEENAGNHKAGVSAWLAILDILPEDPSALQALAALSSQAGNHEQAVDWYSRARRQQPHHAKLLNNLAIEYRAAGHADSSRTLWQESLSLEEDYAEAHYNLGTSYYLAGEHERALPHLLRAVQLAPDSVRYHSNAAAAYRAAGRPLQAVEHWSDAIRIDPTYVDGYFNIAFTLQYDLKKPQEALRHWVAARALAPQDGDIIMHATQALLDVGRTSEAIIWLRGFVEQNPQHPQRQRLEAALETITSAEG